VDRQSEPFTEEMIEEGDMVYAMEHRQAKQHPRSEREVREGPSGMLPEDREFN